MPRAIFMPKSSAYRLVPNHKNDLALMGGMGGLRRQVRFIGPAIGTINGTNGVAIGVVDTSVKFNPPAGMAVNYSKGGTWPAWAVLGAANGQISGTPNATGTTGPAWVILTVGGFVVSSDQFNFVIV